MVGSSTATLLSPAGLAVVVVAVSSGCSAPVNVRSEVNEKDETVYLHVHTSGNAVVTANGEIATANSDGDVSLSLPFSSLPLGQQTVVVDVRVPKKDRKGRGVATFDRPKVRPRLQFGEGNRSTTGPTGISLKCSGSFCSTTIGMDAQGIVKLAIDAPGGSVVHVKEVSISIAGASWSGQVPLDIGSELAELEASVLSAEHNKPALALAEQATIRSATGKPPKTAISMPVKLVTRDGDTLSGNVELSVTDTSGAKEFFARVANGPLRFGNEPPYSGTPRVVYFQHEQELIGSGTIGEIDLIALAKHGGQRIVGQCGSYRNEATGAIVAAQLYANDEEVSVYERRTGRLVGKRTFFGTGGTCPNSFNASHAGGVHSVGGRGPDVVPIRAWLRGLRR